MAETAAMTDSLSDARAGWPVGGDASDGRTSTSRILLVDPSLIEREAIRCAIGTTDDLACTASGSSISAVDESGPDEIDAVLIVAAVPGLDLATEVSTARRRHRHATIVVLSGYVDAYLIAQLAGRGASVVTSTDIPLAELFDIVRIGRVASVNATPTASQVRAATVAGVHGITPRELDVLGHLAEGHSPQQIARLLGVALGTVRDHLKQVRQKLDCASAVELLVSAHRLGLLPNLGRPLR